MLFFHFAFYLEFIEAQGAPRYIKITFK